MSRWLAATGLPQYAGAFAENHVYGAALLLLARDDLAALGVHSVGHRLHILRAVDELRGGAASPAGARRELFEGAPVAS